MQWIFVNYVNGLYDLLVLWIVLHVIGMHFLNRNRCECVFVILCIRVYEFVYSAHKVFQFVMEQVVDDQQDN